MASLEKATTDDEQKKETITSPTPTSEEETPTSDIESSDDEDEDEFKKLDQDDKMDILLDYHPEIKQISYKELETLTKISKNSENIIIDPLHKTIPILTRYEKARVLGLRAKLINDGSEPLVTVTQDMIDGLTIAKLEFNQNKLPFINRRPMPHGGSEYWNVHDLQDLQ